MTITEAEPMTSTPEIPGSFAAVEQNFALHLPGYEARPQQQLLARSIEVAIENGSHLFAQAGCGTGKSLGGVTPMILAAIKDQKRVVVATATKALQEQYANKDMPFLQEKSGIPFKWALLKGRSNYVCQVKLVSDEAERLEATAMIKKELKENPDHTGDFEHFSSAIDSQELGKLATSSNECPGKKECPFGAICFAEKAKEEALKADLVITNTAMFMTDRVILSKTAHRETGPVEMLGPIDMVLFDEAHELPEIAANNLGFDFTAQGISIFAREAMTWAALQGKDLSEDTDFVGETLKKLYPVVMGVAGQAVNLAWFAQNFEPFMDVRDAVSNVKTKILQVTVTRDHENQQAKLKMLLTRAGNIIGNLEDMIGAPDHEVVRWVETYDVRGEKRWRMRTSPVDISPFMKKWVWEPIENVVLMSATLTSGKDQQGNKDFTYMQRQLGLWEAEKIDVGTPFNLQKQGLMFVPAPTVASPKNYGTWSSYAAMTTLRLVDAAKGGALLLFTSRRAMESSYETLAEQLQDRGYTALMQGDGRTNKQLAQIFKEDTHSVLFALKSFFVGVDVPGDACRLVVIDKLPFPVPTDPVYAAKSLKEEREGRFPFNSLAIPGMILTLEQAIGRLIRTKKDRGVVAVLDSRLSSEKWGQRIVKALPEFPVTFELSKVEEFYGGKSFG